jgi:hypothetical protein
MSRQIHSTHFVLIYYLRNSFRIYIIYVLYIHTYTSSRLTILVLSGLNETVSTVHTIK